MGIFDRTFIILDTETTGANPENDKVIEIAVTAMTDGVVQKPISRYVNPGVMIPPSASAVHHIVDSDVSEAPPIDEVMKEISAYVGDAIIVAHNAPFDKAMIYPYFENNEWIDTLRLSRHLWEKGELNSNGFPLNSHTQQELRYWLGLSIDTMGLSAHRAAADILVTAELLKSIIKTYHSCGGDDDIMSFQELCTRPIILQRFPLRGPHFGKDMSEIPSDYLEFTLKRGIESGKIELDTRVSICHELDMRTGAAIKSSRLDFLTEQS